MGARKDSKMSMASNGIAAHVMLPRRTLQPFSNNDNYCRGVSREYRE